MLDLIFPFIYFLGLIASGMMRTQQRRQNKRNQIAISHATKLDLMLMGLSSVGMIILPLIYVATPWVKFADYHLHSLVGLIGIAIYVSGLWLLSKSHADLDRNWMPTVELREGHSLVTQGVFRYIRHPMYAAHWIWSFAQPLLLQNWIAGFSMLVTFLPLYLYRVWREEEMMIDQFGIEYQRYMDRTTRIIPRFWILPRSTSDRTEE